MKVPKSKFQKIYEEKTKKDSVVNHKYSIGYVKWLEAILDKKIIELEATEEAAKEHNDFVATVLLRY
jgi:hypothetical protein